MKKRSKRKANAARVAKPQKRQDKQQSSTSKDKKKLAVLVGSKIWDTVVVGIRIIDIASRFLKHIDAGDGSDPP